MKVLVLLTAAFAIASSSFIGRKAVDVKEDGTIFIRGENGKQIMISKQFGPYGQKAVEIEVTGPNTIAKKIFIDDDNHINVQKGSEVHIPDSYDDVRTYQDERNKRSSYYDVLDDITRQYRGVVDEQSYQQLLEKVQMAVLNGKLNSKVLKYLQGLNEESKWNTLTSDEDTHEQQMQVGDVWNKIYKQQKNQQNLHDMNVFSGLEHVFRKQGIYDEVSVHKVMRQILMKLFDRQVLMRIMRDQGLLVQGTYEQMPVEQIWDSILVHHGIFDKEVLVEIIKTPVLRELFIQRGIFDKLAVEKVLYTMTTQTDYDYLVLEQMVNKTVLKYWLVKQGILSQFFLEQMSTDYLNGDAYQRVEPYGEEYLVQILNNVPLRNVLVQQGIFNRYILDKVLYLYRTQGFYSQVLLKQLINKNTLYHVLMQYYADQTTLKYLVHNELAGLNVLLRNKFHLQTPKLSYKHLIGFVSQTPELVVDSIHDLPYGNELVGIDFRKTIFRPITKDSNVIDADLMEKREQIPTNYINSVWPEYTNNKVDYLRNIIYGQQRFGLNRDYNQGYYSGYQRTVFPLQQIVEQQL